MKEIIFCNTGKLSNPCVEVVITQQGDDIRVRRMSRKITHKETFRNKYPEATDIQYTQHYNILAEIINLVLLSWEYEKPLPNSITIIHQGLCYYFVYNHPRRTYMDMVEARLFSQRCAESYKYRFDRMLVGLLDYDQTRGYIVMSLSQNIIDTPLAPIQYQIYLNDNLIADDKFVTHPDANELTAIDPIIKIDQINRNDKYRLIMNGVESIYEWHHSHNKLLLNLPLIGG